VRLTSGHRQWVYWTAAALFATGALWLVFHYFLQVQREFGPAPHPLEHWWLRLHGAAAMLALLVVGSLLPIHVRRGWHQRRNLPLGIALVSAVLLLTLSGYALYYFGGEEARPWISVFHWGIGIVSPLALVWHIATGRSVVRQKHPGQPVEIASRVEGPRLRDQTLRS
jgi:hypothetical protein